MSVSVCLSVCVCLSFRDHVFGTTVHVQSSPNFLCMLPFGMARSSFGGVVINSDKLCTSGFRDDVMFAHKPRLLDVAAQLKRSAHAALGLAINCVQ